MRAFIAVVVVVMASSCYGDGIQFYQVLRERSEECLIRENGEFCVEPDQFDPPSSEVWSVETREGVNLLVANEEVWVLDPIAEDDDPRQVSLTATKDSLIINGNSGCRTDAIKSVTFTADGQEFVGELRARSVLTGGAGCGTNGQRTVDRVIGFVAGP